MIGRQTTPSASALNRAATPLGGRFSSRRWRALPLVMLAFLMGGDIGATESLQGWRDAFQAAAQSLQTGPVDYSALSHYPLYPYLRYQDLSRRLPELPIAEVRGFLDSYPDSPLAGQLRNAWLRQLAAARRWNDYLRDMVPSRDPLFDCWRRQALWGAGQNEAALRDFAALWLRGSSLPTACDPIIAAWRSAQSGLSPTLLWQRFSLAMANRNLGLARALRAEMPITDQALADTWLAVADNPPLILDASRFQDHDPRIATIIDAGLKLWGKRDALATAAALDILKQRYPMLAPQWLESERQLALWIATDYHPTALARLAALPDSVVDNAVREWRIRVCLRQGDWVNALHWLAQLPVSERDSLRWQYWRGRSLEALGQPEEARQLYKNIANQRDYYSFLAADRIAASYVIDTTPLTTPATELERLLTGSPGLQRARELYILGREPEADAEWRQATQGFDQAALKQAALLAHRWDWHHQAIVTVARAGYWDDLDLRFPLAYQDSVITNARASAVDPAWIYAVIRQESNFRPTARSPVGALGLMQIMPATGQEIARQTGASDEGAPERLLQPESNLRLGVRYLQKILERLQNNPVLATAAYNAGPNKVTQWLPTNAPLAADIWVETIPYQETRSYVQRVLEYATIYTRRLAPSEPIPLLESRMKPAQPAKPAVGPTG